MAFRELSLATGRPGTVPAEAKMVEVTALPPRAGDTKKEGLVRKPGAGQAQPAAGSCPWSSRGHSVFQTLVSSGKSACLSQGGEGLGGDISLVLGLSKEASRGGPSRTGHTRQQWRSIQSKQENT